jgi:hypothetical protein
MLNKSPIFLNCFSRGGSNILWNIFLSHPDVCSPIKETLEIFRTGLRHGRLEGFMVWLKTFQAGLFDQWNLKDRRPISDSAMAYIDRAFYEWKLKTLNDGEMKYKNESEVYSLEEVKKCRLASKNNNGTIFLTDILNEMYPDATFFALVRHPFSLYESHKRRKIKNSTRDFTGFYRTITEKMLNDQNRYKNYHIFKFEDILSKPLKSINKLYSLASLDRSRVNRVRFKAKAHLNKNGVHKTEYAEGRHYWFDFESINKFIEPDINAYQEQRLNESEKIQLKLELKSEMSFFGYE